MDDDVRSLRNPLQTIHWSISKLFHILTFDLDLGWEMGWEMHILFEKSLHDF